MIIRSLNSFQRTDYVQCIFIDFDSLVVDKYIHVDTYHCWVAAICNIEQVSTIVLIGNSVWWNKFRYTIIFLGNNSKHSSLLSKIDLKQINFIYVWKVF